MAIGKEMAMKENAMKIEPSKKKTMKTSSKKKTMKSSGLVRNQNSSKSSCTSLFVTSLNIHLF